MLSNLSNNNAGNATKSVVEKKHYEEIETRLDEMQTEIDANSSAIADNASDIETLDERVDAVENNSTFPTLNTDEINPATGDKVEVTSDLDVDGAITADSANFRELSVNGTSFTTVANNASQAKSTAEIAENKADEAYDLADAVADELAEYKSDNERTISTGTLNADSVVTDSISAQTINTNDFETTNAAVDRLYVDTIKATGFLELPTSGQQYYTITVPAKTTASFSGIYTSDNNTDYPFYFTVSDGAVIYKQGSTEIIKDISFDRETGYTKVRVKSSTNLTYISTALDSNPVNIEDGGDAYTDYAFIPQKTGGYLIRGYDDTTTEVYIAGVLKAYAMSVEEEIIERTSVDFLKINASIELPKEWDAGGTISYSTGEENQYISAQTKSGVTKPTWTSPIHSTIGSLSYSSKLVDEATVASYKGIAETRQTQTISITNEASLQQLTAFHWTKNGTYWQPYELTRITIGDQTMWIDPTEANQGIRFIDNQVIADGTWNDVPVEEANAVPVNLVIFDAPTELSFPITNLGDKTTVHGEITATCFKGNVLGNVTGNADTATNATCFDGKTYAEAKADILSGCAADSNMFNGKTYSEACADILSGNAASATNATCFDGHTYECAKADILSGCASAADNATCFDGYTYADAKADILSGNAASATNATCFNGCTYSQAKADILSGNAASATNATCFGGCTYAQAKADILSGTAAQAHCVDIDSLTTNSYPLVMESTTCELGKSGTCPITFTPSTGILETNQVSTSCIENNGTTKSQCLCATCDINVDGNAYITGDLTVQGTITTTHSEEVVTPSENIILRDGATTPIASGCYSGFTVTNYDGQDNNLEVGADKDGTLHVGVVGGTMEPVATRATEACMEDGYATHWDSTGTDLVTKGTTSTHDLCINGDATATGTITGTFSGNLTGNVAGNADTATNATNAECACCILPFGTSHVYNDNRIVFVSPDAESNCPSRIMFDCSDHFTYNPNTCALTVDYVKATLNGLAYDSAKLGNKDPSCYIDTSSTAQTKAGNLSIGAPSACTSTSAGGNGVIIGSYGGLQLLQDTPTIELRYKKYCGSYSTRLGHTANGRFHINVNNGEGCTACTTNNTYCFLSDGTFSGATNICGTNIYQNGNKVIDTSSTAQCKSGTLNIGNPSAATSTTAGSQGTSIHNDGTICLFSPGAPYINLYHCNACAFSSRIVHGHDATNNNGHLCLWVRNTSNTSYSNNATYDFGSNGTFSGACTICASCNIYSAGCPVVTTETLPTVAPGYNCTGTSNYVVTTMVCCARAVRRNQATTGTCHLAMFAGTSDASNANIYVSSACELTYNPADGVLSVQKVCQCVDSYHAQLPSPNNATRYITLKLGNANGYAEFTSTVDIDVFNNHVHANVKVSSGVVTINEISRTVDYGIRQYLLGEYDETNKTITLYFTFTNYREASITSSTPIVEASSSTTAPTGTFVDIPYANRTSYINTSSSNAEYPLVFSTCCATPAAGNRTLYNDSANNLMYNPSTNTLTTTCVRGSTCVYSGYPTACTSTVTGAGGAILTNSGRLELYRNDYPNINFHYANYGGIGEFTHQITGNNGYLRVTATNAAGCCAATQSAYFDFKSDGTLKATCFDGTINMNCVADAASTKVAANSITRKTILRNQITDVGYITSAAIGLCRGTSGFGLAVLSVSCNDAGSVWKDYCFNNTGRISANGLTLHNNDGINTGVSLKVGTASSNADRNIMFTPAVPGSDNTSTGEVQVSTDCPLTYNPSTGVLTATCFMAGSCPVALVCDIPYDPTTCTLTSSCVKVCNKSLIKGEVGGSAGSNDYPIMTLNSCCFQVYVGTSPDALPDDSSNVLTVKNTCINVGFSSRVGSGSITLGSFSCACGENSIVIGRASSASSCMIVIGNSLSLCIGDDEQSNCINAVVMSPHRDNCWACPSHIFGCARIMFKYGTKQCTMYKFLNCLFSGRDFTDCAYAYASRLVHGDCCGRITGWDGMSYYAIRRNAAYSFCMDNHWSACHSCEDVIPTCCTNGYTSFDLVW